MKKYLPYTLTGLFPFSIFTISCQEEKYDKTKHSELENFENFVKAIPEKWNLFDTESSFEIDKKRLFHSARWDLRHNWNKFNYFKYHFASKNRDRDYTNFNSSILLEPFSYLPTSPEWMKKLAEKYLPEKYIKNQDKYSVGFIVMNELQQDETLSLFQMFLENKYEWKYTEFFKNTDYVKNSDSYNEWIKFIPQKVSTWKKLEATNQGKKPYPFYIKNLLINIRLGYRDQDGKIRSKKDYLKFVDVFTVF